MTNPLYIKYLEVGLKKAENDLSDIKRWMDEYLHVDISSKESMDRYFYLKNSGYDLLKETDKQVELEFAIEKLKSIIWYHNKTEN